MEIKNNKKKFIIFGFYEKISLIYYFILGMLTFVIADGTFRINIENINKIYTL